MLGRMSRATSPLLAIAISASIGASMGCGGGTPAPPSPPTSSAESASPSAPVAEATPRAREGLTIERIPGPAHDAPGDGLVTLVRIDLARYRLSLITEMENEGAWRTLPAWAEAEHLVAGVNAAMFEENGRASGLLVDEGVERAPDDPRFGGVLAFDPVDATDAPFVMVGRDCPGVDLAQLRARYRSLVANYRMLDCGGAPIAWVDQSVYSAAAFARDREGRFVIIHAETAYLMRDLSRTLGDPALGLTDVHYVEGGPKASAWLDDGTGALSLVGSRHEDDGRIVRGPRPIPNVLGVLPR